MDCILQHHRHGSEIPKVIQRRCSILDMSRVSNADDRSSCSSMLLGSQGKRPSAYSLMQFPCSVYAYMLIGICWKWTTVWHELYVSPWVWRWYLDLKLTVVAKKYQIRFFSLSASSFFTKGTTMACLYFTGKRPSEVKDIVTVCRLKEQKHSRMILWLTQVFRS